MTEKISSKRSYLGLLGAKTTHEVEARIVHQIAAALAESGKNTIPLRLSTVARGFSILPVPQFVSIDHDGEIAFDEKIARFVIRLRRPEQPTSMRSLGSNPRYRFTYAHEMAHRFFFVEHGGTWKRALDVATAGLDLASRLREKITLSRIEEGMCNSVARRILIPDSFLSTHCPLDEWFSEGSKFFSLLTSAARSCCVSRDVLLLRLEKSRSFDGGFAMIIGFSTGPVIHRGRRLLRVLSGLLPSGEESNGLAIYPGIPVQDLGLEMVQFAAEAVRSADSVTREFRLPLRKSNGNLSAIAGWWRSLGKDERFIMWGRLEAAQSASTLPLNLD